MNQTIKITLTVIIVVITALYKLVAIAVGASSHNISKGARYSYANSSTLHMIAAAILIICLWLPWKKILKK